jgi:small subunit ribosomal protein S17
VLEQGYEMMAEADRQPGSATRHRRRERTGVVVSDAMNKTVVVKVEQVFRHPKYEKVVRRSRTFYAHDEAEQAGPGDTVRIRETRPLSKLKRWRVVEVLKSAPRTDQRSVGGE